MLNYNKISSDINKRGVHLTEIARHGNIKYTSFRDRFEREKLYADEIEVIADYFGRSISYYFDREEKPVGAYVSEEKLNVVNEPCPGCEQLRAELARLNDKLNDKQETIDALKEANTALKGEAKKEKPFNRTA